VRQDGCHGPRGLVLPPLDATHLDRLEARAVSALDRINEIERKPLSVEDLAEELREAVKEFTPPRS